MPSVLFVCRANQFRSPLAAAIFWQSIQQEANKETWIVESAGTWTKAGSRVPAITLQLAGELGLAGLERHRTRQIDAALLDRFELILLMEQGQKEALAAEFPAVRPRLYLLSELVDGMVYDIPDPFDTGVEPHEVGWQLRYLIKRGKDRILERAVVLSGPPSA
jgi:protein-tyrosine phosphatase